jgi:hypothetical protein
VTWPIRILVLVLFPAMAAFEGNIVGTVNYVLRVEANDYLELIWATTNAEAYIHAEDAATSPFAHPGIPGIICTATQVVSA